MLQLKQDYRQIANLFLLSKAELNKKMIAEKQQEAYNIYKNEAQVSKYSFMLRNFFLRQYITQEIKEELNAVYNEGFGIKTIAAAIGHIGYSNCRLVLSIADINLRTGRSIVTDKLKESRKIKALNERNNKTGWFNTDIRDNLKIRAKTQRGVQGWYFNQSMQKWVWLRSTYEYIFAKWLDSTKHLWDVEVTQYQLSNETYRPDFFIYDDSMNLLKIIEIKGYRDNRAYKVELLNELLNVDVCIIGLTNQSIGLYVEKDLT